MQESANTNTATLPEVKGFTISKKLGSGKSAVVYLATQDCFDREVALKILHKPLTNDPSFKKRFSQKMQQGSLLNHPALADVYAAGESNGHMYIAMEYFPSGNLTQKISQQKSGLFPREVIRLFQSTCEIFSYCHQQNFIHGNFHNSKLYFRSNGDIAIIDMTLTQARIKGKIFTQMSHLSPEVLRGADGSKKTDLYAIGISLYQALTGKLPFDGENNKEIAQKHIQTPAAKLSGNNAPFQSIIDKLLVKNPEQRLGDANILKDLLIQLRDTIESAPAKPDSSTMTATDDFEINTPKSGGSAARIQADNLRANLEDLPAMPSGSMKVPVLAAASVFLLIAAATGGWLYTNNSTVEEQIEVQVEAPVVEPTVIEKIDPKLARIERLLAKAKEFLQQGRYVQPIGNNAYGKYRSVLDIDSNNITAQNGVALIAAHLVEVANTQINKNKLNQAEETLQQARSIDANAAGLAAAEQALKSRRSAIAARLKATSDKNRAAAEKKRLKAERIAAKAAAAKAEQQRIEAEKALQEQLIEEERLSKENIKKKMQQNLAKLRINGLINKANTYFTRGEFHSPAKENALEKYSEVIAIDPSNSAAQQGLNKVVDKMLPEIEVFINNKQYSMAKNLYDQAYTARPKHAALNAIGATQGW